MNASAEAAALIEVLISTDQRLETLLAGEIDTVSNRAGDTMLLRRAQTRMRGSDSARQGAILNALPAHIALLDSRGVVVAMNAAWTNHPNPGVPLEPGHVAGVDYLTACSDAGAAGVAEAAQAAAGIRAVLSGALATFVVEYRCNPPQGPRWFRLRVTPLAGVPPKGVVVTHTDITERKQSADELAELSARTERRERMLSTMLSSISDFAFIYDLEGKLVFANQALLDRWRLSAEEAAGRDFLALDYPPQIARRMRRQLDAVVATRTSIRGDIENLGRAGEHRDYEYIFSPVFAADGSVDFVTGSARDITERKQAELALRKSVENFNTLAAAMPQLVWIAAADGRRVYFNQQWCDYTGLTLAQSVGGAWQQQMHPADALRAQVEWTAAMQSRQPYAIEARLRRADGVFRWWLVRSVPLFDDAGRIEKWIGSCTDIDELQSAQNTISQTNSELQRQSTELRILFDLVPAMIWFKDTADNILRVNKRAADATGLSVAEIEGRPSLEIYPRIGARVKADDLAVLRSGVPRLGVSERIQNVGDLDLWVQTDKVPYRDGNGAIIGIVVMAQDITGRKRDQEALEELNVSLEARVQARTAELNAARDDAEQANRAKSAFLAHMSHEIRTPMTGMFGLLELLGHSRLDDEQRATLAVARESGHALLRIIDDILDFSKIEADRLELHRVPASVRELVHNACRLQQAAASARNIRLDCRVAGDIGPLLLFDPLRLSQILNNFLNNAIKFTEHGSVDLTVERTGGGAGTEALRFVVRDTGIGISAANQRKLFHPFVQGDVETSARFGGTGLGLVISRRLAGLMGGTVSVQSEEGVGTAMTLCVSFNVAEGRVESPGLDAAMLEAVRAGWRQAPTVEDAVADRTLLLVVDDHPTSRMVLTRQLALLGYASQAASDGEQAFKAWKTGRFAAILTDCDMPRMSGYELATAVRDAEKSAGAGHIPIIACTANALPDTAAACAAAGMDDCIVKPANLAEIRGKLEQWVPVGVLDLALLAEISGGDPQMRADILDEFRRVNAQDVRALEASSGRHDYAGVLRSAHRIKGAALMLGATALAATCARLEASAADASATQLRADLDAFWPELTRFTARLDALHPVGTR